MELKDKKILLVGLGILGGGLSVAKYFISKGTELKITDLRTEPELKSTIKKLPSSILYTLGHHDKTDFEWADLIFFNQAVPATSEWVKLAKDLKKEYHNDYSFLLKYLNSKNKNPLIIGVTGTRGKTTVANWIQELIPGSVLAGNIPDKNILSIIDEPADIYVLELSSFQLEYADSNTKAPNIAVLTNVYVDHLNRYGTFEKYKEVKFNIFRNQSGREALILNYDEAIVHEVMVLKPRSKLYYVSLASLPHDANGMYFDGDDIYLQHHVQKTKVMTKTGLAPHEKHNLLMAMLCAHLSGVEGTEIAKRARKLKNPKLRQELILKNKHFEVYNDSAGTSPEATIAAIEKFKDYRNLVLITGGTNKELDFSGLAKKVSSDVKSENLFLLEGSATDILIKELGQDLSAYENLEDIVDVISQEFENATVVFSPGAASFEKFKNEFDRGAKFTVLAKKYLN